MKIEYDKAIHQAGVVYTGEKVIDLSYWPNDIIDVDMCDETPHNGIACEFYYLVPKDEPRTLIEEYDKDNKIIKDKIYS